MDITKCRLLLTVILLRSFGHLESLFPNYTAGKEMPVTVLFQCLKHLGLL